MHRPGSDFLMTVPRAPCKDCADRYPGCHDHCLKEEYAAYRGKLDTLRRKRNEERMNLLTHRLKERGQP